MAVQRLLVAGCVFGMFSSLVGCGDEVGECEDPNRGQDTVLLNGRIQYGGQAIMNQACAQGCHSSSAQGASRQGAPAGLDFDLQPVDPDGEEAEGLAVSDAGTIVKLRPDVASGLRERQRRVFEDRDRIWQQVKDGLMPPDGQFARFRKAVSNIFDSNDQNPCAMGKAFESISEKSSQDVLRKWLSCGAPIVESTSPEVMSYGAAGAAGYQYPACGVTPGDGGTGSDGGGGGTEITIESVHMRLFSQCTDCHSPDGQQEPDLSTPDKAYAVLVEDSEMQCDGKPYVTKGDPTQSYFYEILKETRPGCGTPRMPPGGALTAAELKLVSDWIAGGALRQADTVKSINTLQGGLDAGVR